MRGTAGLLLLVAIGAAEPGGHARAATAQRGTPANGAGNLSLSAKKRPPANTAPPSIAGQAQVGLTLSGSPGSWSGTQPITYAYRWLRCDAGGAGCTAISGATALSYTVAASDQGSTLRFFVKASNSAGSASAQSAPTALVAGTTTQKLMYWGAWIGSQLTGNEAPWDMTAVAKFESMAGRSVSLIHFSSPFANCSSTPCSFYTFPTTPFNNIRGHGSIPFFSWSSASLPVSLSEPNFQLADVTSGTYDSYITSWATAAKNWGHPFFLRFNWEMNGDWFPWSDGVNGNQPGDFVKAWRHVHDVFTAVGATNATWVWCPNVDSANVLTPLAGLYPGDSYVDWTCLDGYNWNTPWTSFDSLFSSAYTQIAGTVAPSKPMVIGETASTEQGGSKASWITDLLTTRLPAQYPKVKAFLWFEKYDSSMDWPIETSSSATSAFASGIQLPYYAANQFGALAGGPIQPLS